MRLTPLLSLPLAFLSTACLWGGSDDAVERDAMLADDEVVMEEPMEADADVRQAIESPLSGWTAYGKPIATKLRLMDTVGFALVADDASKFDGKDMRMTGVVDEVCQKKGCWMTMVEGEETVRVTFRDYSFFVPMDISGKHVVVDGTFQVEMMDADIARHYLEDAGKHEEAAAITGPVESLVFVADSVLIKDL